jgi:hypothetical protein
LENKICKKHEVKEGKTKKAIITALHKPSVLAMVLGRERRRRRESVEHKSHEQRGSRGSMCRLVRHYVYAD